MNLQKRLAAQLLKCSPKKIRFDPDQLDEIKESITKHDVRGLLGTGAVYKTSPVGPSRVRIRKRHQQRKKGRRRGHGSRKGTVHARLSDKIVWINKVRKQRALLHALKAQGKVSIETYHDLYRKSKGGFFRSVRHIKLYLEEKGLAK